MDAKQACDKLNGFNFQNRYLVGKFKEHHMCMVTRDLGTSVPPDGEAQG